MKTVEIKCDACDADLTYTGNCVDYRLVLASENKPIFPGAGFVTSMGMYPAVDRTYHFCGLECLDYWRDHERSYDAVRQQQSEVWRNEHGTKDETGRILSYPCPPKEVQEVENKAAREMAMAEFPLPRPRRAHKRSGATT